MLLKAFEQQRTRQLNLPLDPPKVLFDAAAGHCEQPRPSGSRPFPTLGLTHTRMFALTILQRFLQSTYIVCSKNDQPQRKARRSWRHAAGLSGSKTPVLVIIALAGQAQNGDWTFRVCFRFLHSVADGTGDRF